MDFQSDYVSVLISGNDTAQAMRAMVVRACARGRIMYFSYFLFKNLFSFLFPLLSGHHRGNAVRILQLHCVVG